MATHNKREINASELYDFISSISPYIEIKIKMYALGGTALTIKGIKKSTRDIDLNLETDKEYNYICKTFLELGFERKGTHRWISQEGLAFDIFKGSNIMGTELLPDCLEKSKLIKSIENIQLYILSSEDIIISKLARGDPRDFEDIKSIFNNEKIDLIYLIKRYKKTMENSIVGEAKNKLLDLIRIKFKDWNIKIDKETISEVEKWEL